MTRQAAVRRRGGRRFGSARRQVGVERLEGRALLAGISGSVFQSIDVSGVDPNDPALFGPIPSVTVRLNGGSPQVTDGQGRYSFANVAAGPVTVTVDLPQGFVGTDAQSLSYTLTMGTTDVADLNFALAERNQAIVQNLYELVLQRPATFDEFTAAVGRLDAGQAVSAEFGRLLRSTEYRSVVQPAAGFVQAMFPGVLEIELVRTSGQQQRLGIMADATIQGIMNTQPFVAAHGDTSLLTNEQYVRFLYRELLGRSPAPGPLQNAINRLAAGTTRGQLALDLVGTPAFQGRAQVQKPLRGAITYVGVLGREATTAEIRSFAAGAGNAVQLASRLSASAEFRGLDGFTSTATWDVMAMAATLAPTVSPLARLQRYNPATKKFEIPVTAGSLTSTAASPKNVYFVSHGWAPGQSEAVLLGSTPGNPLRSWAQTVQVPPWLFDPTPQVASTGMAQTILDADPAAIVVAYSWIDLSATPAETVSVSVTLPATGSTATLDVGDTSQLSAGMSVTGTGIAVGTVVSFVVSPTQVVVSQAPTQTLSAQPLVFAGTDLEATVRSLAYVGQSESRTQWAGLMLAQAIEQALADDFFGANQGLVHIMGHSHGAKVAVVATGALEAANVPVSQLTLFDSPETGPVKPHLFVNSSPLAAPGVGGGQNFVWRFLQELPTISKTPVAVGRQATGGTFVDNYYSQTGFGAPFGGYAGLGTVVDVLLRPAALYNPAGGLAGDLGAAFPSHGYPPAWYAQASLQNPSAPSDQQNGLSWSPLLNPTTTVALAPSYDQYPQAGSTTPGEFVKRQFELAAGGATPTEAVTVFPLVYGVQPTMGEVTDTGSSMTFAIDGDTPLSAATISFDPFGTDPAADPIGTGLELDVAFTGVDQGETVQLVVSVHGMAALGIEILGQPLFLSGATGFMTLPLLTLEGGSSGTAPRMATISLDVFRNQTLLKGGFATAANPVPKLVFSLIGSAGATASATVTNMRQFGTPTAA